MNPRRVFTAAVVCATALVLVGTPAAQQAGAGDTQPTSVNWSSFRGNGASGVADGAAIVEAFNGTDGTNVAWKTPIPGLAHASPIVWGERVYLTTAVSDESPQRFLAEAPDSIESVTDDTPHRWMVMALDKHTGAVLWEREAAVGVPRTGRLRKGSFNNATPATDGSYVVALLGSQGLFCYDVDGNFQWSVDLGVIDAGWFFDPSSQWGPASSPIVYDGKVIVQVDAREEAFIAAFDVADGQELWRAPRDEVPSWATPAVAPTADGAEIITNGGRAIRAYDATTGAELWSLTPSSEIAVPTPVVAGGYVFVTSGYLPTQPVYAIRPGGRGDISLPSDRRNSREIAWSSADRGALLATPIVVGNYLFLLGRDGTLTCFDAATGLPVYRESILAAAASGAAASRAAAPESSPGAPAPTFTASPVAANGKLYIVADGGDVYVVDAGPILRVSAVNPVGEAVFATPAITGGMLLVRGQTHLFAFAAGETQ